MSVLEKELMHLFFYAIIIPKWERDNNDRRMIHMVNAWMNGLLSNLSVSMQLSGFEVPVTIGALVAALLICFFGLKFLRLWNVLWGLVFGAGIGFGVASAMGLEPMVVFIVTAVSALIMAILSGVVLRFGAFCVCLSGIFVVAVSIVKPGNWVMLAICGGIGLLAAIAAMIWLEPMVIVFTAIYGGFTAGEAVSGLFRLESTAVSIMISVAAVVLGFLVQFVMKSSEINKKEVTRAKAIREESSKENEVEQARNILDLNDKDEE